MWKVRGFVRMCYPRAVENGRGREVEVALPLSSARTNRGSEYSQAKQHTHDDDSTFRY